MITDLASLGEPGTQFTRDFFLSATLISFPDDALTEIAKVKGVAAAAPALIQLGQHQSGTVPKIVASLQTGGQTFTQTVRPEPMTDAERTAFQACLIEQGRNRGCPAGRWRGCGRTGRTRQPGLRRLSPPAVP